MQGIIKVTGKGQITLPAGLRKRFNIKKGTYLRYVEEEGEFRVIPVSSAIADLRGKVAVTGVQDFAKARHAVMEARVNEKAGRD